MPISFIKLFSYKYGTLLLHTAALLNSASLENNGSTIACRAGLGKLRPVGHKRPAMGLKMARESLQQIRKKSINFC